MGIKRLLGVTSSNYVIIIFFFFIFLHIVALCCCHHLLCSDAKLALLSDVVSGLWDFVCLSVTMFYIFSSFWPCHEGLHGFM